MPAPYHLSRHYLDTRSGVGGERVLKGFAAAAAVAVDTLWRSWKASAVEGMWERSLDRWENTARPRPRASALLQVAALEIGKLYRKKCSALVFV